MICFDRDSGKDLKGELKNDKCTDGYKGFCKFLTLVENKFSD